jgi:hypothetical protein
MIYYRKQGIVYIFKTLFHRPLILKGGFVRDAEGAKRR